MITLFESMAGTEAALITIWAIALIVFVFWLIAEFRGMVFASLIPWKPVILKSLRIGFVLSVVLPPVVTFIGSFAGPWGVLIVFLGMSYLPPSVFIFCTSLGGLFSVGRSGTTLTSKQQKAAYATLAAMAAIGFAMMYVSLVWLNKPV